MSNGDAALTARGTDRKGIEDRKTPDWLKPEGGQPMDPSLQETRPEISESKASPGRVKALPKNKHGQTWQWLVCDFAVDEHTLKAGHIEGLRKIVKNIRAYSSFNDKPNVYVNGHASPSGSHEGNRTLALARATQVINWLMTNGGIPLNNFKASVADLYGRKKGLPDNEFKRAERRSAQITLYFLRNIKAPERFPETLRQRIRKEIPSAILVSRGPKRKYERNFYHWVLENWEFLDSEKRKYWWESTPHEHGLFFEGPKQPLRKGSEWHYLRNLYRNFDRALQRLRRRYAPVEGGATTLKRADPLLAYQQLGRWIGLDSHARHGQYQLARDVDPTGVALPRRLNQLIGWINTGEYGKSDEVWKKIDNYVAKHRIPIQRDPDIKW